MPRIHNWKDLTLYKADRRKRYKHVDRLFSDTIDWNLIDTHWKDLMQVALSIQVGSIASPLLLKRLSAGNRRNRMFLAAQELGRVVRKVFLLKWISSVSLRQDVTAETNKIEFYNSFAKWFSFGGDVIAENEPDEQQKRLRFNDLVASSVILQNTVDMMKARHDLEEAGRQVSPQDIGLMSPYMTAGIKRLTTERRGRVCLRFLFVDWSTFRSRCQPRLAFLTCASVTDDYTSQVRL